jgi:hypothetical protein
MDPMMKKKVMNKHMEENKMAKLGMPKQVTKAKKKKKK